MEEYLLKEVKGEYERWKKKIGDRDDYVSVNTVGIQEVMRAHFLLADYFYYIKKEIGGIGPKNLDLLHSALYRQFSGFGGVSYCVDKFEIISTLFYGLIKNHAFHDANKRTAFLVSIYHLQKIGRWPSEKSKKFEQLTVDVADNNLGRHKLFSKFKKKYENPEVKFIADFFKRKTREIDNRYYSVTYQQLNTILNSHGFKLVNPHKNYIDVCRLDNEKKVAQVGFPGWKTQVGKGAICTIRTATNLTPMNGYDSMSFFKGVTPLDVLIDKFKGPLIRLANK